MAVPVANINYSDTFAGWLEKTNQVNYVISTSAVTTAANSIGGSTTGNASVVGILSANVFATAELRGGTVAVPAALSVSSNVAFNGGLVTVNSNTALAGANLTITSTRTVISSANLIINSNTVFANTVSFTGPITYAGLTTFSSNVVVSGTNTAISSNVTLSGASLSVAGNTTFAQRVTITGDLTVVGNLTFTATSYGDIIASANGYTLGNNTIRWSLFGATGNFTNNVTIAGVVNTAALNVNGIISTTGSNVVIASAVSGAPTTNAFIIVNRGTSANAYVGWDETNDKFVVSAGANAVNLVIGDGGSYSISIAGSSNTANSALTANNATNFNGQAASFYANATNLTSGTLPSARLSGTYGITITGTANNASNFNGQAAAYYLSWANFTGKPTTVSGYGITDAVTLAGAQSIDGVKTFSSNIVTSAAANYGNTARQMLNLYGTTYGVGVQDLVTYVRTQKSFAVYTGGSHSNTENDAGSGGSVILLASNSDFQYKGSTIWHAGNYTRVISVEGVAPNGNGDVLLTSITSSLATKFSPTNLPTVADVTGLTAALDGVGLARGSVAGLTLSNTIGFANTQVSIASGQARDYNNTQDITLASGISKRLDAVWAVGTGNGGRDTADAIVASSYYHVFIIYNPTTLVTDALFSQSATAPTLPSGYTKYRRIGAILTTSASNVWAFNQQPGGYFHKLPRGTEFASQTNNFPSGTLRQLHVPRGIKVRPSIYFGAFGNSGGYLSGLYDPDNGTPPSFGSSTQWAQIRRNGDTYLTTIVDNVFTDTNGQVYSASNDTSDTIVLGTLGWWDYFDTWGV